MKNNSDGTVAYAATEIDGMIARGETKTDFARWKNSKPLTDAEFARLAAEDPDFEVPGNWEAQSTVGFPPPPLSQENKRPVTIRLDPGVVDYFKAGGRGWQSRINAALVSLVRGQQERR